MLLTSSGLDVDLNAELDLMEALIKVHLKGYQVWFVTSFYCGRMTDIMVIGNIANLSS